jgi:Ser/Thr protein kinase RdoA (MazF antagonist)
VTSSATTDTAGSIERLARAALPAYDLPDDAEVTLLNLTENATFRVNSGARDLIVRVHRAGYHTSQEIASELAWIAALGSDTGINVPRVVPTRDGDQILTLRSSPLPDERHHVAFEVIAGREPMP